MPDNLLHLSDAYAAERVQTRRSKPNNPSPGIKLATAAALKTDAKTGELALLNSIRSRSRLIGSNRVRLGIGDDCALLRPRPGEELAVTTDLSIEGRHFRLDWHPPESVGHRTLARGLSDLAAMGARPMAAFLSLGLPRELTISQSGSQSGARSWVDRFLDGLLALATQHRVPLAGGDLAESGIALADIMLIGASPQGEALLRSGARPGDAIYVTGSLGGAAAELGALGKSPEGFASATASTQTSPHLYPQPRIAQGIRLRKLASAAMDLSDGLSTDLAHICEESRVAAEIDAAAVPLGPGATLEMALHGGEDYELLFTAPASARVPRTILGVPITRIGQIKPMIRRKPLVTLLSSTGAAPLLPHGWEHFSGDK
jgi:thiamine-monophosphate kinase